MLDKQNFLRENCESYDSFEYALSPVNFWLKNMKIE